MGGEMLKIGVEIRRFVISSIKMCFRSVCDHPFLVGMAFFLFFLYRSFPLLFSLFVSASPVLVCTAVLLGTLLSFGQPNIPEMEKEENVTCEIVSLKTGFQRDDTVVEREQGFVVERYTEKRKDVVDKSIEEESSTIADMITEVDKNDGNLVFSEPLIEENSREIQLETMNEKAERELDESGFETKSEMKEQKLEDRVFLENQYSRIETLEKENIELGDDKSPVESVGSSVADRADGSPISPWKRVEEEEEEEVDDEASDSESDGAESSSPDASMTDIIPMLDELHPLLDEDAPQPAHMSHDGSDGGSERSQKSTDSTNESDEDSENQEEEVGDDDNDEEDEETKGQKADEIKSVITWTEDDQKNLMDLGTSELERNQRLENLIARRRARRLMIEKNLIDLESTDLPFNVAPISTARRNPFDIPYDSNDSGLPPIPGSAPSILLARRNPFDIPYDSSEEKPDLKGDNFQQEFVPFAPKEMFFRRHESFNVGPSFFAPPKQESKFKPFFVPERVAAEGTSYSSFQRQSSELSDSKVSSVPETESVCSAGDQDDTKLIEEEISQEADQISDVEHSSVHVGHGSESSEDVATVELGHAETGGIEHDELEIKLGDLESQLETSEIHMNTGADEVNCSSRSSSSSLSEDHERIFDEKENGVLLNLQPNKENVMEEAVLSIRPSLEESEGNTSRHWEPVYDSSPPAVQKNLSSSSLSSDLHVETSEMVFMPVLVKRTVSFADSEFEVTNRSIGVDTLINEEILADSSQADSVDKDEIITNGVTEKDGNVLLNHGFSENDPKFDGADASAVPEIVAEHKNSSADLDLTASKEEQPSVVMFEQVSGILPTSSSFESESVEEHSLDKEVAFETMEDQVHSTSSDANFHIVIGQEANEEQLSTHTEGVPEEHCMYELEEQLLVSEKAMVESSQRDHGELVEPSIIQMDPIVEVSATSNLDASELEHENGASSITYSPLAPESTTFSSEVSETRSPSALPDLKDDNTPGTAENPAHIPVQPFNYPTEVTSPHVHEPDIIEEADEIKEIDEGLLMELDTVGDFSVKDLGSNFNEIENNPISCEEMTSEMPLVEARSVEEIDSIFKKLEPKPIETEVEVREVEILEQSEIKEEINSGMPVLEARSLEDIQTAFRQIHEEEIKMQVVVESVHAEPLPEEMKAGCSKNEISHDDSSLTETNLSVVEARSSEDIELVFKQLHIVEKNISSSLIDGGPDVAESRDLTEISPELHVERPSKPSSVEERLVVSESKSPAETISDMNFSESRPWEDADVAPKPAPNGNLDSPMKAGLEDGSANREPNEAGPSKEIESSIKEPDVAETCRNAAEKPEHGAQTSEDLNSNTSDGKGKKAKAS